MPTDQIVYVIVLLAAGCAALVIAWPTGRARAIGVGGMFRKVNLLFITTLAIIVWRTICSL